MCADVSEATACTDHQTALRTVHFPQVLLGTILSQGCAIWQKKSACTLPCRVQYMGQHIVTSNRLGSKVSTFLVGCVVAKGPKCSQPTSRHFSPGSELSTRCRLPSPMRDQSTEEGVGNDSVVGVAGSQALG